MKIPFNIIELLKRKIGDHVFGHGGGEIVIAHGSCR